MSTTKPLKDRLLEDKKFVKYSKGTKKKVSSSTKKVVKTKKKGTSPTQSERIVEYGGTVYDKNDNDKDDTLGVFEGKSRYFIEMRSGEAVDLIKASILSRPAVRRYEGLNGSPDEQRYAIKHYVPTEGDSLMSPLASRLSELAPSDKDSNSEHSMIDCDESSLLWSPASAMRLAREKTNRDSDIVPTTKTARKTKSAKRSLKMLQPTK